MWLRSAACANFFAGLIEVLKQRQACSSSTCAHPAVVVGTLAALKRKDDRQLRARTMISYLTEAENCVPASGTASSG